ncbi:lipoprotein 17-related variable surface protein, partial [Mycoplasmopsis agassizii]
VTSGANDTDGTLKVKVVLKSTSGTTTNYYKQNGDTGAAADGVEVTISGFATSKDAVTKWYSESVKDTSVASNETLKAKKPSEVTAEELKSLFTAPTTLTGSTVEVEKVANGDNDVAGNLKLKVTLKQGDNFFKEDGSTVLEANKATAGKTVTISGFVASDANAAKASTWYETKVQDQHVEEIEALKTKKPSEVSDTTDKTELDKLFALPTGDGAFDPTATIEYSDLKANDYTGSLSLKVALKVGDKFYDKDGNQLDAAKGETVELTGFADYKEAIKTWYTAVTDKTVESAELKAKAASAATEADIKGLFTAPDQTTLPNSEFSVTLTADDAAGTVSVKVVFSATVDGKKLNFNANGSLDESETATGKTVTVSGFKVDTTKADVTSWY